MTDNGALATFNVAELEALLNAMMQYAGANTDLAVAQSRLELALKAESSAERRFEGTRYALRPVQELADQIGIASVSGSEPLRALAKAFAGYSSDLTKFTRTGALAESQEAEAEKKRAQKAVTAAQERVWETAAVLEACRKAVFTPDAA